MSIRSFTARYAFGIFFVCAAVNVSVFVFGLENLQVKTNFLLLTSGIAAVSLFLGFLSRGDILRVAAAGERKMSQKVSDSLRDQKAALEGEINVFYGPYGPTENFSPGDQEALARLCERVASYRVTA